MKSLVLFGDSLFGRFGKELIVRLETAVGNITVYNCAAGGFTSEDGRARAQVLARLKPDYLVLSFCANDAAPWKQPIPLERFMDNLETIMNAFTGSKIFLFPCPLAYDPSDLEGTEKFNAELSKYTDAAIATVRAHGATIIETSEIYGNLLKNGNDYHMGDGIHLNEEGYKVFIEALAKLLKA